MNKLLIVDDYEIITDLIEKFFQNDYECIVGHTTNFLNKHKDEVDLIISDYGLKDDEGLFEWSTEVLSKTQTPKILITGATPDDGYNNYSEDKQHVDYTFFKPLDLHALKDKVEELLEKQNA